MKRMFNYSISSAPQKYFHCNMQLRGRCGNKYWSHLLQRQWKLAAKLTRSICSLETKISIAFSSRLKHFSRFECAKIGARGKISRLLFLASMGLSLKSGKLFGVIFFHIYLDFKVFRKNIPPGDDVYPFLR